MRILTWINWRKIVRFETQMLKRITAYVSVSELDRQKTMVYASGHVQHFLVAPNGVDLQRFQPRSVYNRNRKVTLGFVGSFDVHLNRDAAQVLCRQILPTVKKRLQEHGYDVALLLVGRNPPTQIRELANLDSSIRVTGTVESMPPYLQQMDLLVLPLREGAGTKLRTLEAMATGLPVIGTSLAFEGIHDIEDGVHARVVSDIDSLPDAVVELACQPELRLRLGTEARRLVERCYNWEAITARLAGELASLRATRFLTDVGL
jgi:glycosyltransferase involved in cell wall biosynthesis